MNQIPEIPLAMNPQTIEARAVIGFRSNQTAGKKHKLEGVPDWIQGEETPDCPNCTTAMTFYGQLDCIGDSIALGDCGMIYVFSCFECGATQSLSQSF